MNDIANNKLLWIVVILAVALVAVFFVGHVMTEKVANRVIQKLQKDYSPSPYGPGVDPDKVDPEAIRRRQLAPPPSGKVSQPSGWDRDWEGGRN